ncbi:MAG: hypothetical protein ACM30G_17140 [Micromonosporaceae bacterium]
MSRIDAYLDAMVEALDSIGDAPSSAVHIADVAPFFMDVEALDLVDRLRRLDAEGVTDRQLAELFPCANAIKTLLMDLVCGLKVANVGAAERVRFTERMFDAMQAVEFGDVFCRDGTHRVWPAEQAQHYAETARWSPVDTAAGAELARAAFRASASGQALVWALYFYAWTDMGWEVHGPYDVTLPTGQRRARGGDRRPRPAATGLRPTERRAQLARRVDRHPLTAREGFGCGSGELPHGELDERAVRHHQRVPTVAEPGAGPSDGRGLRGALRAGTSRPARTPGAPRPGVVA